MKWVNPIATVTVLLTLLPACTPQKETHHKEPRRVDTVTAQPTPVSGTISVTGEVRARVQSDLSFRVSGRVVARSADIGDRVKAGQVLGRIDPTEQSADLQVVLANLRSAEALATQAQQAFDRQQSLFASQVTTRAALDEAQEGLLTARSAVSSAQAQVDAAKDALTQTELTADADGVITARSAEVGQVVQAAQPIFTLAHDGPRDAVINADETLLIGRTLEEDIEVRPLSGDGTIKARVREVSPAVDPSTGTVRVKLALDHEANLPLGSPVVATARYKPVATLELPWSAMSSNHGTPAVWVVDPQTHSVSLRSVEVSAYGTGHFSLREGVLPGEIVVTNGSKFLSGGEVVSFEASTKEVQND